MTDTPQGGPISEEKTTTPIPKENPALPGHGWINFQERRPSPRQKEETSPE
jgi:hypothetical protein